MRFKKIVLLALLTLGLSMPLWAEESGVTGQLKSIQAKQEKILAELAEIKAALEIIKIRTIQ